ncbi:MAG TPA: hypothetical protein VFX59_16130 [Polyangiales bacterium]|nr:hypothetical protein [Polyangiales bacterium]
MRAHRETFLRFSSLVVLTAGLVACDQPSPKCNIARGLFSARYTLVPGSVTGTGTCGELLGEELWVAAYNQRKPGSTNPDPDHIQVGIISTTTQDIKSRAECSGVASTASETPYALGSFASSKPDSDDFCHVPTLTPSQVTVAEAEAADCDPCQPTFPTEPAHDVRYEWSNVRVFVTAGANGTQFAADLKRSIDGCSAQFKVTALYPSVSCAGYPVVDMNPATGDDAGLEDGGPVADAGLGGMDAEVDTDATIGEEDAGEFVPGPDCPAPPPPNPIPDETLCSQDAPITGGPSGTNINPEFMVQCDQQQLRCVLSSDPPSLR